MSFLSGWSLTGRLITKHFEGVGDAVASAIASFDPETATEADRDHLASQLQDVAAKLAQARQSYDKEHADVEALQKLIANDTNALSVLQSKLAAGTISESTVETFLDEIEANKGKLPAELQQEEDAKQYRDELQKIVTNMSDQLAKFDENAKKAKQNLASAQAHVQMQELRTQQQNELASLSSLSGNTRALDALNKKAQALNSQAEGMKIVADIGDKPAQKAAEIDSIRQEVAGVGKESTNDRLKRLLESNS